MCVTFRDKPQPEGASGLLPAGPWKTVARLQSFGTRTLAGRIIAPKDYSSSHCALGTGSRARDTLYTRRVVAQFARAIAAPLLCLAPTCHFLRQASLPPVPRGPSFCFVARRLPTSATDVREKEGRRKKTAGGPRVRALGCESLCFLGCAKLGSSPLAAAALKDERANGDRLLFWTSTTAGQMRTRLMLVGSW